MVRQPIVHFSDHWGVVSICVFIVTTRGDFLKTRHLTDVTLNLGNCKYQKGDNEKWSLERKRRHEGVTQEFFFNVNKNVAPLSPHTFFPHHLPQTQISPPTVIAKQPLAHSVSSFNRKESILFAFQPFPSDYVCTCISEPEAWPTRMPTWSSSVSQFLCKPWRFSSRSWNDSWFFNK